LCILDLEDDHALAVASHHPSRGAPGLAVAPNGVGESIQSAGATCTVLQLEARVPHKVTHEVIFMVMKVSPVQVSCRGAEPCQLGGVAAHPRRRKLQLGRDGPVHLLFQGSGTYGQSRLSSITPGCIGTFFGFNAVFTYFWYSSIVGYRSPPGFVQ
jgi:hypothetical protein